MPVKRVTSVRSHEGAEKLLQPLINEWRQPHENEGDYPLILEEGGDRQPLRLYVIWNRWDDVDDIRRSELIMDAYEEIHGLDQSLNVTVAMGLTPDEARNMGIHIEGFAALADMKRSNPHD